MDMLKRTRLYDHDDDRISELPDCVLLEILSALPTKDAVRTSCLSKRWTSLWTLLPNLVFRNTSNTPDDDFFSCVDKTMAQLPFHHKLNKFQLRSVSYERKYESQVNKWIRHAISCNVQDLDLSLGGNDYRFFKIVLDELLFNNSIFTHLKLACFFVNPTGTFSWINLNTLYISDTDLNEDLIQNILSGSPVLETFTLHNCYGFENLDITSKSVKEFVISGSTHLFYPGKIDPYGNSGFARLNAPNILSLKIQGSMVLWEIEPKDVSSLVEAHLDYTDNDFNVGKWFGRWEEVMLGNQIRLLRHVKELKLGVMCSKTLSRLEAKGFVAPSNIKHVGDNGREGDEVD